ncbi:MAG: YebC/PmpR family DNA-binding transcriptional regulator [Chthoniobacterales bacterium]|nr:YebC/PmpR family DNA-binding transcriptional regulator [Chthoniobacterales bacterium]
MGRQWLLAKREVSSLKKSKATGKFVREITIAARQGGADSASNARLAAAIDKAKRESVSRDVIERAIQKGSGTGDDKTALEHIVFEGYTPHKVPVIVEVFTDNNNRTAPEIRVLFREAQLGNPGSNKFLFDHVGLVEAYTTNLQADLEEAAIEAGASEVEPLTHAHNDDIPNDALGARFITERTATHTVSEWLSQHGWKVIASEIGYVAKSFPELSEVERHDVATFLEALEEHEDVHRVWAALK